MSLIEQLVQLKEGFIARVHGAYVNPDFMTRMEPQAILDQLKKLE